jgi:hypothetical protein
MDSLICHIEEMLLHEEEGMPMSVRDELDGFANNPYEDEARETWGHTDAYKESARRTKAYTADDWKRYQEESSSINERFVALMDAGAPADSKEARMLTEEHRSLISRWFYECSPQMHAGFGEMWQADPRFAENIDKAGTGLSDYMATAFKSAAQ